MESKNKGRSLLDISSAEIQEPNLNYKSLKLLLNQMGLCKTRIIKTLSERYEGMKTEVKVLQKLIQNVLEKIVFCFKML